jgi:hypothetical protein
MGTLTPQAAEKVAGGTECEQPGLKPALILNALRGAEAPLFHVATHFPGFFRSLLGLGHRRMGRRRRHSLGILWVRVELDERSCSAANRRTDDVELASVHQGGDVAAGD